MRRKELYFKDGDEEMSQEKWQRIGSPVLWFLMYNKHNIAIYHDRGYGSTKLCVGEKQNTGRGFVVVNDIVVFDNSYSGMLKTNVPYILKGD